MIYETLKKSAVFTSLPSRELETISTLFREQSFNRKDHIVWEGDPSDCFYIISKGKVKVLKHTVIGREIIIEILSTGDIIGDVFVSGEKFFSASAQAIQSVTAVRVCRQNLIKIMEQYPILKLEIARYFSNRMRDAYEMLVNIATVRVKRRIVLLLLKLSEKMGSNMSGYKRIDCHLTRQDISEMVGTTVETCTRIMSKFQKQGMIKSSDKRIMINSENLKEFIEL